MPNAVRVLIADGDSGFMRRAASAAIAYGAGTVRLCGDGAGAEELLVDFRPGIFITDIPLRRVDGLTLLGLAEKQGTLCAVATYMRDPSVAAAAKTLGAEIYMLKPCPPETVVEAAMRRYRRK